MSRANRAVSGRAVPSIEAVQTDIGFGNQYRLELIKTTFAVAAGVLAFTTSFRPTIEHPSFELLMWLGWIGLGLSICQRRRNFRPAGRRNIRPDWARREAARERAS